MTKKFKKAVKDVVADGVITPEEETLILNLAKEEGISENDAKIYLIGEIKKIMERRNGNRETNWETTKSILVDVSKGALGVIGLIGTVLTTLDQLDKFKKKNKK